MKEHAALPVSGLYAHAHPPSQAGAHAINRAHPALYMLPLIPDLQVSRAISVAMSSVGLGTLLLALLV